MASRRSLDQRGGCPVTSQSPSKLPEPGNHPREVLFISHAAPEDNAFTI